MTNEVLLAIPLFIFMGVMLERSRIAEELLETMGRLFGTLRGGLGHFGRSSSARCSPPPKAWSARHGDHGSDHAAGDAALRLRPAACRRHGRRDRDAGADFPPATVLVLLGDQLAKCLSGRATLEGQFRAARRSRSAICSPARWCRASRWSRCTFCYSSSRSRSCPKTSPAMPPDPKAPRGFALARRLVEVLVAPLAADRRRARLDPRRHRHADGSGIDRRGRRDPARGAQDGARARCCGRSAKRPRRSSA